MLQEEDKNSLIEPPQDNQSYSSIEQKLDI